MSSKDRRSQSELGEGSDKILVSERFEFDSHVEYDDFGRKIEGCFMLHDTSNWRGDDQTTIK